jgi:hypothetical protein
MSRTEGGVVDEGDDAHLGATNGAHQRKNFVEGLATHSLVI